MQSRSFERFAGLCAILAGVIGFLYSIAFIVVSRSAPALGGLLSALFLTLGGIVTTAALAGVYQRLRETDATFALWALLLGLLGAVGANVHGGYDLANALHPPASLAGDLPSPIDPRGLLTFGVAGIGMFTVAWLMVRGGQFPRGLGYLGYLLAILLVVLYLGRLLVLNAASPVIVVPALLAGFLVNPIWYIWAGLALWRGQ